jgi:hypothetical protein
MQDLIHQRCNNHMYREAVARCPECGRFFCRECITEHDDKVLCAACLRKRRKPGGRRIHSYQWFFRLGHFFAGLVLLYVIFYYVAQILLALPADFHDGTLWQKGWWTQP